MEDDDGDENDSDDDGNEAGGMLKLYFRELECVNVKSSEMFWGAGRVSDSLTAWMGLEWETDVRRRPRVLRKNSFLYVSSCSSSLLLLSPSSSSPANRAKELLSASSMRLWNVSFMGKSLKGAKSSRWRSRLSVEYNSDDDL